jgi:hypothetical protein
LRSLAKGAAAARSNLVTFLCRCLRLSQRLSSVVVIMFEYCIADYSDIFFIYHIIT